MEINCEYIPYQQTGYFSKIITDYLDGNEKVLSFYKFSVDGEGFKSAIDARANAANTRQVLVEALSEQYAQLSLTDLQQTHLNNLLLPNTFTVTTAHQPNIFTGHLYFIYKILHAVKLANHLAETMPQYNFVPVYYMGSEDADLDELGHINVDGQLLKWNTKQTGAVGRMVVDQELIGLIDNIQNRVGVLPFGDELATVLRQAYRPGITIQQATLRLVHELFKEFGVLVLIPDSAALKRPFNEIVKRELTDQFSHKLVEETAKRLGENYKVQASGRDVNLFYLYENYRERIEFEDGLYLVKALNKQWDQTDILQEVDEHPERFSANVILRGVFQEMILPNIAFIGGGGELAYWLELKEVFEACNIPFPVLVLRNSFVLLRKKHIELLNKLRLSTVQMFKPQLELMNQLVNRETANQLTLAEEKNKLSDLYHHISGLATAVDPTLTAHVSAVQKRAFKTLLELERKMLRAEKRKFQAEQRQLTKLKLQLFPQNDLQERVDNFALYYAEFGKQWLQVLYNNSLSVQQQFAILTID